MAVMTMIWLKESKLIWKLIQVYKQMYGILQLLAILQATASQFEFSNGCSEWSSGIWSSWCEQKLELSRIRRWYDRKPSGIGSRRWNWKFRERYFLNPKPELLLHSSYIFWPYHLLYFLILFIVADLLSPNSCHWEIAKVENYNLNVTEFSTSPSGS